METPIQRRTAPPVSEMRIKTSSLARIGARPEMRATTRASSRRPCPKIISGPVDIPRLELSLTVTVKSGPGMSAPESAITNEVQKIVISAMSMGDSVALNYP